MRPANRLLKLTAFLMSIFSTVSSLSRAEAEKACHLAFPETRFSKSGGPIGKPRFSLPPRIVTTKFGGKFKFQSGLMAVRSFNGRTFSQDPKAHSVHIQESDVRQSLLAEKQTYSLKRMVETDYLSAQMAHLFFTDGFKRETGQITYHEMLRDLTPDELRTYYGAAPEGRSESLRPTSVTPFDSPNRTLVTATLYSASGQVWDHRTGVRNLKLPWENEESRKGQELDRTRHPYVWEWGRAGQDAPGEVAPLYAANAISNYVELRAMGGKLEDAFVMAHSFREGNSHLYSKMFPGSLYPKGWTHLNDALFLFPLKEALAKHPPRSVSNRVARILEISEGRLNDLQALDLLIDTRTRRWSELDYRSLAHHQETPVIIRDVSSTLVMQLITLIENKGLDQRITEKMIEYLLSLEAPVQTLNDGGKYDNSSDSGLVAQYIHPRNGIEVSNLDPKIAVKDPYYAGSVVMSAFSHILHELATGISRSRKMTLEESYPQAAQEILKRKVSFAVTTHDLEIQRQLLKLQPTEVISLPKTDSKGQDAALIKEYPYWFRESKIYIFPVDHIRYLIQMHPDFYMAAGHGLKRGIWQTHQLISQPDLF